MIRDANSPIVTFTTSYLDRFQSDALRNMYVTAMQCGFKLIHGNNPRLTAGKRFDGTKVDAKLVAVWRLNKKKRFWTHETVWAVREMLPRERALRILTDNVEMTFFGFREYALELQRRFNIVPTPTDEVVYSKRLGVPKPKKAPFESVMVDDWWRWDDCDWDDIFAF